MRHVPIDERFQSLGRSTWDWAEKLDLEWRTI